jgi:GTPase SAR1 family protein
MQYTKVMERQKNLKNTSIPNNRCIINNFQKDDNETSNINICLVGCVSAGKSTILNSFFCQNYAECKIKRTTMMPNKFIETDDIGKIDDFKKIGEKITEINKNIYNHTQQGKSLNLEDYGGELTFNVGNMDMNVGKNIKICIYDIPGLNDAKTKDIYYEYLKNNFHKFNIILFVVDIQSGLNTSDEMDILKFLSKNIKKHKEEFNKNINMLTIVNKADEMQLSEDKLEVLGELGEMFIQVLNTIQQTFSELQIKENMLDCIPVCGLDAYLYRMIKKFRDISLLSDENILRIGINEEGSKFRKYSKMEQKKKVELKIRDNDFVNDMIKLSGFSKIEEYLNIFISNKGSSMVIENMLWKYEKIPEMTINNIIENITLRINILELINNHDKEIYETEMKNFVKKFNTLIFIKIKNINNPTDIKFYYDMSVIEEINLNKKIKLHMSKFFSLTIYPNYIVERITNLIINKYSEKNVCISNFSLINLLDAIDNLNIDVIELIINTLIDNQSGLNTFEFDISFSEIIEIFEKLKSSKNFLPFIRFYLMNFYYKTEFNNLTKKLLLFTKYGEILLCQFIQDLRIEKKLIDTNKNRNIYCFNKTKNNEFEMEFYYISKSRELGDYENFTNHDFPLNIC